MCAELWLQKRAEIEHPLGAAKPLPPAEPGQIAGSPSLEPADLLVEIGCEELPPADIQAATQQLRSVEATCHEFALIRIVIGVFFENWSSVQSKEFILNDSLT